MNERVPPRSQANVRAEEAIIGKILSSADSYWSVANQLTVEHFTLQHHRDIFAAVALCCEEGSGPALSLLETRLPLEWEGVGSVEAVLPFLIEKASDVSASDGFIEVVLDAWRERERIAVGRIATTANKTFDQTRAAIEDRFRAIDDVDRQKHAITLGEAADGSLKRSAEAYENHGTRVVGIETGIAAIDKVLGPLVGGTLLTIAAQSGHGKSALLSQILRNNGAQSLDTSRINPSLFISMEMSRLQNGYRNLSSFTGIPVRKQVKGDFTSKEFDALLAAQRAFNSMPIYIQDRGRLTASEIVRECRIAARRYGVKLIGIDHLRLIRPEKDGWNDIQTIEHATAAFKELAKELDAVIIQLAQLTREDQKTGNWRFKDSAIYGGGMVKANSDLILGVALPIEWLRQNQPEPPSDANPRNREIFDKWLVDMEKWKDRAEFSALKVRDGAAGSWKELDFDAPRMTFGNQDREAIPF